MTDEELFAGACWQITLVGFRDSDGSLTIYGHSYENWPDKIVVQGQTFVFSEEEGERSSTGYWDGDESKPENVRAFYDAE